MGCMPRFLLGFVALAIGACGSDDDPTACDQARDKYAPCGFEVQVKGDPNNCSGAYSCASQCALDHTCQESRDREKAYQDCLDACGSAT